MIRNLLEQNFARLSMEVGDKPDVKTGQVLEVSEGALACLALHRSLSTLVVSLQLCALNCAGLQFSIL